MRLWRICRKKYAATAFSGMGAAKSGGRWNHPGFRMVYASENSSLAQLELFVHLDPDLIPRDLVLTVVTVPERVSSETVSMRKLPRDWRNYPAPAALRDLGTDWLQQARSLLLRVPSAVNPLESNLLINPLHPEFATLGKVVQKPFKFDPRLWK